MVSPREHVLDAFSGFVLLNDGVPVNIGMLRLRPFRPEKFVGIDIGMEHWRAIGERIVQCENRKIFVLHENQAGGILRNLARVRGDGGDPVTDQAHAVTRQCRPVQQSAAEAHVANIVARQYRVDPLDSTRIGDIHRDNAGVRSVTSRVREPEHAWQLHVGRVAR